MPRQHFPHAGKGRSLSRYVPEAKELLPTVLIERLGRASDEQCLLLGGEAERTRLVAVIERFDPYPVSCEEQRPIHGVPNRDREHAI